MRTDRISITRTDWFNSDFRMLVAQLDKELAIIDGADHTFYSAYNKIENIQNAVVAYEGEIPIACGAIKQYSEDAAEVKRMYVKPELRGQGFSAKILSELEKWAAELGYEYCILETGKKQIAAIGLYKSAGYTVIPNYGQYAGVDNSICMKKKLKSS